MPVPELFRRNRYLVGDVLLGGLPKSFPFTSLDYSQPAVHNGALEVGVWSRNTGGFSAETVCFRDDIILQKVPIVFLSLPEAFLLRMY